MTKSKLKKLGIVVLAVSSINWMACSVQQDVKTLVYWNYKKPYLLWIDQEIKPNDSKAILSCQSYSADLQYKIIERLKRRTLVEFQVENPQNIQENNACLIQFYLKKNDAEPKIFTVYLDSRNPKVQLLQHSKSITRGGSAVVIFEVSDPSLEKIVLKDQNQNTFNIQKFHAEHTYISVVNWYLTQKDFILTLNAKDKAGNTVSMYVPIKKIQYQYPESHIQIKQTGFFKEKKDELSRDDKNIPQKESEQYDYFLKKMGQKYFFSIGKETAKPVKNLVQTIDLSVFKPVDRAMVSSPFGSHRFFYNGKKRVRDSYHWGVDLYRDAKMNIYSASAGEVIYSGYNGGNGNMVLIHHGLAVYTLYAHCSELLVKKGQRVQARELIAKSGTTGYSFGDHLHFSVMVQNRFVNPTEWMDSKWLARNFLLPVRLAENYLHEKAHLQKSVVVDDKALKNQNP